MDFAGTAARKRLRGVLAAAGDYSFSPRQIVKDNFASARDVVAAAGDYSFSPRQPVKDIFASARDVAAAAGDYSFSLRQPVKDIFASARDVAAAAGDYSVSLRQLVKDIFASLLAALASVSHELFLPLEALWRWTQTAFAGLLPVALVILLVAIVWYCWQALFAVGVGVGRALVCAVCNFGRGLYLVAVAVARALACLLPSFVHCCAVVTMKGPGAAGMLISRAAFVANPALYFRILRSAGPFVAAAVFCSKTIASVVASLFRA